ncbi:assembly factor cbp4 [Talaromyces proteolyticus]|uniref:Cytochrome b mRNA-processing protein 4 n=1 Tax=Talaromyces proteolyticus TaxID=1131652 RepID=A0AAD4KMA8_9EURO|nr:assembly factor cbp4 [Talaromyces proteolyticus]KAH8695235.1 assembly factor cbp4 [Talaromyces proteolyticus]
MPSTGTWVKMITLGAAVSIGGPLFVQSIRPSDEELFSRYNPELQKSALENRDRREKEYDEYVNKLKEWSKSDKSIWFAVKEEEERRKAQTAEVIDQAKEDERKQREEMRRELQGEK